LGRDLLLEGVLLGAREVARVRGLIRVTAHPLGGELVEERRNLRRRRRRLLRRNADHTEREDKDDSSFSHKCSPGLQACHCSTAYANSRTPRSSPRRPTICIPTGSPSAVVPAGTEAAGHRVVLIQ